MESFSGKRRPSINLSLFTNFSESFSSPGPTKSPRNFENGVVGLGIVAAMTDSSNTQEVVSPPRSTPISIVSSAKPTANFRCGLNLGRDGDVEMDELSENYTCVISRLGNNLIKKSVYFGDEKNCSVFAASSWPMNVAVREEIWGADFLSSCYLCKKQLQGLDIFMYRGEKAFCSTECRDKYIRSDDHREKCGSEARKQLECSASPCSGPPVFLSGVAAA
ncbi:hypothetical protein SLEP1_g30581 [Rubroshorea leprosula]|uniref:FLZ-type domain-containing protein n=1 Tax=Rubroshorea leprosula TaxID=152421 RepID=A0AAV5K688_9ROSI|nr:hypothetical protein SLEP1_g30581 [Rubroshorea leprosula]